MGGRIRPEGEVVLLRRMAQVVEHAARLDSGELPLRIDLEYLVHVLGKIHHHGNVAALAGETGPAAASQKWCSMASRRCNRVNHVIGVSGYDHADRHLAVVGAIRGIQCPAPGIESYFTAELGSQLGFQSFYVHGGTHEFATQSAMRSAASSSTIGRMWPP